VDCCAHTEESCSPVTHAHMDPLGTLPESLETVQQHGPILLFEYPIRSFLPRTSRTILLKDDSLCGSKRLGINRTGTNRLERFGQCTF
jgi:hypothetical protein